MECDEVTNKFDLLIYLIIADGIHFDVAHSVIEVLNLLHTLIYM